MQLRIAGLFFAIAAATLAAEPSSSVAPEHMQVTVSVVEPAGVGRKAEPASGGIPFMKGQVKSVDDLALFAEDGKPVAAQFTKLAPYEDGSVQWALVDALVDIPASGKLEFVVKSGKAQAPEKALTYSESDTTITVGTGVATFAVSKSAFNVLESVRLGSRAVAGPGSLEITSADGKVFRAGKPSRVSWEYRGPIRATLRVDGDYCDEGGSTFISYTTRLTFWASSALVRVEQSIRNSNPKEGDDVKIKSAKVSLGFSGERTTAGRGWLLASADGANLLVSHRHTGGAFPGYGAEFDKVELADDKVIAWVVPEGQGGKGIVGYGAGFFVLADCAHKDSRIWFDFAAAAADGEPRHKALLSNLHVLADGAWVSATGCMGYGQFGTLADEIASYKKWGWQGVDDRGKQAPSHLAANPYAYVDKEDIHEESEADNAELSLLMYLRTGERGWFDQGEAWARYHKTHYAFRTDGFEYDGFRHIDNRVSRLSRRPCKGLVFGWYEPKAYGWADSRLCCCHFWGNGVFDYYYLTGDVDALEAGLDLAEYALLSNTDCKVGGPLTLSRKWGRNFQCVVRAYQVTREGKWRAAADSYGQSAIKASNRRADGVFPSKAELTMSIFIKEVLRDKAKPKLQPVLVDHMKTNGIVLTVGNANVITVSDGKNTWEMWETAQSFEFAACCDAVARYAAVTGDKEAEKLVVDMAVGARTFYWSEKCQQPIPHPFVGLPTKDRTYDRGLWDESHANCPNDPGGAHNGYDARFLTDVFARAYSLSGDREWLEWAKKCWSRGSRRPYQSKAQGWPEGVIAAYAGTKPPNAAGIDIRNCARLFYEASRGARKDEEMANPKAVAPIITLPASK